MTVQTEPLKNSNAVTEEDLSPYGIPVKMKFPNGSVIDNGDGTFSIFGTAYIPTFAGLNVTGTGERITALSSGHYIDFNDNAGYTTFDDGVKSLADFLGTKYTSTVAIGTSPYACTSTTLNTNLNADMLDGSHISDLDDRYLGNNFDYFFDDAASDVSGYKKLSLSSGTASNLTATISADNQLIEEFITDSGNPNFTLHAGAIEIHFHAKVDATLGTKASALYFNVYKYNATVETLLFTTEETGSLTTSESSYGVHGTLTSDWEIASGDRLLVKLYSRLTGSGGNPTVTFYMEGVTESSIGVKTNLTALDSRFFRLGSLSSAIVASDYLDQAVKTTSSPTFAKATLDSDTDGLILGGDQDVTLYSNGAGIFNFKAAAANTDLVFNFAGTTYSGQFKWMEDENYFSFTNAIFLPDAQHVYFRATTTYIASESSGYLDLSSTSGIKLRSSGTSQVFVSDGYLSPESNNDITLGNSGNAWANGYTYKWHVTDELYIPNVGGDPSLNASEFGYGYYSLQPALYYQDSETLYYWLSASSGKCPFIYTFVDGKYKIENDLFPHAFGEDSKDDYLVLKNKTNKFKIKEIAGEFSEFEKLEMIAVKHKNELVTDRFGNFYTISKPIYAKKAVTNTGDDVTSRINFFSKHLYWKVTPKDEYFSWDIESKNIKDYLTVTFPKVNPKNGARLLISSDACSYDVLIKFDDRWIQLPRTYAREYWSWDVFDVSKYLTKKQLEIRIRRIHNNPKINAIAIDTTPQCEMVKAVYEPKSVKLDGLKLDIPFRLSTVDEVEIEFPKMVGTSYVIHTKGHYQSNAVSQ